MKKLLKWMGALALIIGVYAIVHAATLGTVERFTSNGTQIWVLKSDGSSAQTGSQKFGSDSVTPALPTAANGDKFGIKVPVYNVGASATAQGTLLCSSNTGTGYVAACVSSDQKTVFGTADDVIASGGYGYASVAGYALVLTTGTVAIGDVIVSTVASSGYGAANNSPTSGTDLGIAMSAGTAAGGLTLIRLR